MQGTDDFYIKRRYFFEKRLHLRAVFAHNAEIISSGFVRPRLVRVGRAELAEGVSREKHLVRIVICDGNLRPVNHGRKDKIQSVTSERERPAVFNGELVFAKPDAEEIINHGKRLCVCNDGCVGIGAEELRNAGGMIRLHMVNDEVIRLAAVKRGGDV